MKEKISWKNLKVTIPYVMGQLSEKKVLSMVELLKENYFENAGLIMANSSAAAIALVSNQKSLVIEPQQITYSTQLDNDFDIESIRVQFEAVLNSLLIDDHNQYLFNMEGISETEDSHTDSRDYFGEKFMALDDDVYGVGYRFLIKNDGIFGELKIEPFVSDQHRYYYQWLLNKAESVTIADMLSAVKREIEKDRTSCFCVIRR